MKHILQMEPNTTLSKLHKRLYIMSLTCLSLIFVILLLCSLTFHSYLMCTCFFYFYKWTFIKVCVSMYEYEWLDLLCLFVFTVMWLRQHHGPTLWWTPWVCLDQRQTSQLRTHQSPKDRSNLATTALFLIIRFTNQKRLKLLHYVRLYM